MLDLDANREGAPPRDAATLVLVRDAAASQGIEVFCVERSAKSRFLGGAIVFPGGKLDSADRDAAWRARATAPRAPRSAIAGDEETLRALAVCACRETLEEAAILHVDGPPPSHDEVLALRTRIAERKETLLGFLEARSLRLDLAELHAFARWVTPTAESRRFDARFFLAVARPSQRGAHDGHETMASLWATPREVLDSFVAGAIQLAPPTHRTLELLTLATSATDAIARVSVGSLEPICPKLVPHRDAHGDTMALVLPGDSEHDVRESRVPGSSRYVLRGERWLPEDAPR